MCQSKTVMRRIALAFIILISQFLINCSSSYKLNHSYKTLQGHKIAYASPVVFFSERIVSDKSFLGKLDFSRFSEKDETMIAVRREFEYTVRRCGLGWDRVDLPTDRLITIDLAGRDSFVTSLPPEVRQTLQAKGDEYIVIIYNYYSKDVYKRAWEWALGVNVQVGSQMGARPTLTYSQVSKQNNDISFKCSIIDIKNNLPIFERAIVYGTAPFFFGSGREDNVNAFTEYSLQDLFFWIFKK